MWTKKLHLLTLLVFLMTICIAITGCTNEVENESLNYKMSDSNIIVTYSGMLTDGVPSGDCFAVIETNGQRWEYIGAIGNGTFSGEATVKEMPFAYTIVDRIYQGCYSGSVVDGIPDGQGKFMHNEGDMCITCEGSWENGVFLENATVSGIPFSFDYENRSYLGQYSGVLRDGKPNGRGSFSFYKDEDYIEYDGMWMEGRMSGEGELNSTVYVVHFSDVDRQGIYTGRVKDGLAYGQGSFMATNSAGVSYQYDGEWKDGLFNGQGNIHYDDDGGDYIGNFEDGEFKPSFTDVFVSLGTSNPKFRLTDKQIEMLAFFNDNDKGDDWDHEELAAFLDEYTYSSVSIVQYKKKPSDYDEKLFFLSNATVEQINEYDNFMEYGKTGFRMIVTSPAGDEVAYLYGIGETPDIFEGSKLHIWGYPLAYSSYKNVNDQDIYCIVLYTFAIAYAN